MGLLYATSLVIEDDVVLSVKLCDLYTLLPDTHCSHMKYSGLGAAFAIILITGLIEFRDGPFIRPHPALWRLVLAVNVSYLMVLVFLLFQSKGNARAWLGFLDSRLGKPLPERSYAEDCSLTSVSSLWDQLDVFVLAHTIGWFAKALILRDVWFCWILSILFELMEYSLEHQLPNFAECWWDHWILDVLLTNWLGMYLGMKTCQYLEMKQYSWRGLRQIPTASGKLKRTVQQFTPHSWTKFEWGPTKSLKNFLAVVLMLALALQCELNAFYLKTLLWIPIHHPFNLSRLILYFLFSVPAVREAFQYVSDPRCKRLGTHAWMTSACVILELLICLKFGRGEFPKPAPFHVILFWSCFVALLVGYALIRFTLPGVRAWLKNKTGGQITFPEDDPSSSSAPPSTDTTPGVSRDVSYDEVEPPRLIPAFVTTPVRRSGRKPRSPPR